MSDALYFIGIDAHGTPVDANRTRQQIAAVTDLECAVTMPSVEGRLAWLDFEDPEEPESLFQRILRDREAREALDIRPGTARAVLAAQPSPYAIVSAEAGRAVRLEYVELLDFRAPELHGRELAPTLPR